MTKQTIVIVAHTFPTLLILSSITAVWIFWKRGSRKKERQQQQQQQHDDYDIDSILQTKTTAAGSNSVNLRPPIAHDYEDQIGKTPLLRLNKLSSLLPDGKSIHVKMECCNPGGTGKDRAALFMLRDAEEKGLLPPPLSSAVSSFQHRDGGVHNADSGTVRLPDDEDEVSKNDETSQQPKPKPQLQSKEETSPESQTTPPPKIQPNKINQPNTNTTTANKIQTTIQTATSRTRTGGIVVEGTSGSTGISLATLCARRGHSIIVVMPDDQAAEKRSILSSLGAVVHVVPNASISNANHYVNVARRIAEDINGGGWKGKVGGDGDCTVDAIGNGRPICAAFMNQFENESNYRAHVETTGPEIWKQTEHKIDAFCMSSGTGATLSGTGRYLKDRSISAMTTGDSRHRRPCQIILVDPPGSVLYNKVKFNVAYASEQRERSLLRHRYDTIAEGIGLDRITHNFALGVEAGVVDDAVRISDQMAVDMAHWLLRYEDLFIGSSSAMNVFGAVVVALGDESLLDVKVGPGACIVTVICDGGQRHLTRFWNRDFVRGWGLQWPGDDHAAWMERLPPCLSCS